jgi:hypothetical protein
LEVRVRLKLKVRVRLRVKFVFKPNLNPNPDPKEMTKKGIPYIVTHDGRTIRYPDPMINVNDVVKIDILTGKIISFQKFDCGKMAMITKG